MHSSVSLCAMSLDSRLPGARDDDVSKSHGASSVWPFGYVHKDNRHERARTIPLEIIQDREALGTGERKAKVSVQTSGKNNEEAGQVVIESEGRNQKGLLRQKR